MFVGTDCSLFGDKQLHIVAVGRDDGHVEAVGLLWTLCLVGIHVNSIHHLAEIVAFGLLCTRCPRHTVVAVVCRIA